VDAEKPTYNRVSTTINFYNMKNLKSIFGLAIAMLFILSACNKEELSIQEMEVSSVQEMEITPDFFHVNDLDIITETLNPEGLDLNQADAEGNEKCCYALGPVSESCCNVGNIVNLVGGTNRFRVPLTYDKKGSFIVTVWQGNSFQGNFNSPENWGHNGKCLTSHHLIDLDNYAQIQQGQNYTFRIYLYDGSGPFCDSGQINFVGE